MKVSLKPEELMAMLNACSALQKLTLKNAVASTDQVLSALLGRGVGLPGPPLANLECFSLVVEDRYHEFAPLLKKLTELSGPARCCPLQEVMIFVYDYDDRQHGITQEVLIELCKLLGPSIELDWHLRSALQKDTGMRVAVEKFESWHDLEDSLQTSFDV
ncbi:hypothetical protein H0H81_011327 [Sphagnurus paluster]|uniref:Uncharacterized protein n=1 Tax=Sphagnurus paluster TaxID=117069 RepID=A0A9P7FUL9_9AGAR|nr:hypothetical protein H0H81_011327 [Sphagnurus paluster]